MSTDITGCGAPEQSGPIPASVDLEKETVITGMVCLGDVPVAAAWGLLLAVSGIWYSLHGRPTERDQTTIARAEPVVAQAVADVVRAAGTSVVPALSGFEKTADCSVTPVRGGAEYQREVWLYTPVSTEPALLDRIAHGLPARYRAVVHHPAGGAVPTLAADAGYYVAVTGSVERSGLV